MIKLLRAQLREKLARRWDVPEIPFAMERLAKSGFSPTLIFDIGAYEGEFAKLCLRIWPKVSVGCFEPLTNKIEFLNRLKSNNANIRIFNVLMGEREQNNVELYEAETASSILEEHIDQGFSKSKHIMMSVDSVVKNEYKGQQPNLLKIDTQGYEYQILQGSEESLGGIEVVLAELNLIDVHKNCHLFDEIVGWLSKRDMVLYDICGIHRRPLDQALWQIDAIFVKRNSKFRLNKSWGNHTKI